MATAQVPIAGGSYEYRSRGVSSQVTMNLLPEIIETPEGKTKLSLLHTAGEILLANIGEDPDAPCRGFWYSSTGPDNQSLLYAVYGDKAYRINSDYSWVEMGQVASGTGPIGISDNGFDVVFADGVALYKADLLADDFALPASWAQVDLPTVDGQPLRPSQVFFLNQRLIINSQANQFYFSNLASTKFTDSNDVPNFYSAESSADAIVSMIVISNRLWIFGQRSYEVWSASGTTDSDPFTVIQGSSSQIGSQSPRCVAGIRNKVFFLGSSDAGINTVFMADGLNDPERISTNAIEHEIGKIDDTNGGIGWCYYSEGHTFYILTFQQAQRTFMYDTSTGLWTNRSTRDWDTTTDLAWEAIFGVTAYNKVLHGGLTGNRLIQLDNEKYTDYNDREVVRQRITPVYYSDYNIVTFSEFYLDMEVGTTPFLNELGRDPQVLLDISRDGGYTWVNLDWRSMGTQGEYEQMVKWSNLGSGRSLVLRITFSDPTPVGIYGGRLEIEESARR